MNNQFKDFPLCVNCKYYMDGPCGLTMINLVTGELEPRRNRQAAAYRKELNPCGPGGAFFKPGKKKAEPKKKPVVIEESRESTAKVINVDVPDVMHGVDKAAITKDNPILDAEQELLPTEEPKKRRRRSK